MSEPIKVEVTDTFGGEANYSWVRRYELPQTKERTTRQIVREAKALASWTGLKCRTTNYVDMIELRPVGICQVMFIQIF